MSRQDSKSVYRTCSSFAVSGRYRAPSAKFLEQKRVLGACFATFRFRMPSTLHCKCLFLGAPPCSTNKSILPILASLLPRVSAKHHYATMQLHAILLIGIYWHGSPQVLKPSQQTKQASHNVQPEQRQQVANTNPGNSATEMTGEGAHEGCRGGWKLEKELFQKCPTSYFAFLCSSHDGRSRNLNSGNYSILQFVTLIAECHSGQTGDLVACVTCQSTNHQLQIFGRSSTPGAGGMAGTHGTGLNGLPGSHWRRRRRPSAMRRCQRRPT